MRSLKPGEAFGQCKECKKFLVVDTETQLCLPCNAKHWKVQAAELSFQLCQLQKKYTHALNLLSQPRAQALR